MFRTSISIQRVHTVDGRERETGSRIYIFLRTSTDTESQSVVDFGHSDFQRGDESEIPKLEIHSESNMYSLSVYINISGSVLKLHDFCDFAV